MYLTPQRILLAGATGLTGEHLLDRLLGEPTVERVLAPTRRPLASHPRLDNPVGEPAELLAALEGPLDTAFCCLGSALKSTGAEDDFRNVDHDLALAVAERARALGARHLLVVTAQGADAQAKAPYLRIKGELEADLRAQDWPQLTFARPVLPLDPRDESHLGGATLSRWLPGKKPLPACELARALWRLALEEEGGVRVVEADELARLGR